MTCIKLLVCIQISLGSRCCCKRRSLIAYLTGKLITHFIKEYAGDSLRKSTKKQIIKRVKNGIKTHKPIISLVITSIFPCLYAHAESYIEPPQSQPESHYMLCDSAQTCSPILISRQFTQRSIITSLDFKPLAMQKTRPNFLDRQRVFINNQFLGLKNGLDRILSQKKNGLIEDDRSFLVLNLESIFGEAGEHEFNVRARAKADLPNTKQRFKFIFESQPEEDVSLQNSERVGRLRNDRIVNDNAVAGIEFTQQSREFEWRPSIDVGSRLDFPLDVFTRFRLRKKNILCPSWMLTSRFDFSYFAREGAIPAVSFNLDKTINDVWSFLSVSRYKYTDEDNLQEYFQSVQLNHIYSDSLFLEYKLGAFGDSEPHNDLDGYFTHVAFKKRVYDDWIYFSVIPEISFRAEDNWNPSFALTLQVQSIYSNY